MTLPRYITISIFPVTIVGLLHTRKPVRNVVFVAKRSMNVPLYEILHENTIKKSYLVSSFFLKKKKTWMRLHYYIVHILNQSSFFKIIKYFIINYKIYRTHTHDCLLQSIDIFFNCSTKITQTKINS